MNAPRIACLSLALWASTATAAGTFVAVGKDPAVLYDAPSLRAEKQFIAARYYPLEVLVRLDQWTKVRDQAGDVGWIENKALAAKRYVVVTAEQAEVRAQANDAAPVVFSAQKQVALELTEPQQPVHAATAPVSAPLPGKASNAPTAAPTAAAAPGASAATPAAPPVWVRVSHRDGQSGFIRSSQVWGL
jgi:SH3-like domain-containing protein